MFIPHVCPWTKDQMHGLLTGFVTPSFYTHVLSLYDSAMTSFICDQNSMIFSDYFRVMISPHSEECRHKQLRCRRPYCVGMGCPTSTNKYQANMYGLGLKPVHLAISGIKQPEWHTSENSNRPATQTRRQVGYWRTEFECCQNLFILFRRQLYNFINYHSQEA